MYLVSVLTYYFRLIYCVHHFLFACFTRIYLRIGHFRSNPFFHFSFFKDPVKPTLLFFVSLLYLSLSLILFTFIFISFIFFFLLFSFCPLCLLVHLGRICIFLGDLIIVFFSEIILLVFLNSFSEYDQFLFRIFFCCLYPF